MIHRAELSAQPDAEFVQTFDARIRPALATAGLTVVGAYLPERSANTFPRLPVREGEKVFVWFARASSADAYATAAAIAGSAHRCRTRCIVSCDSS